MFKFDLFQLEQLLSLYSECVLGLVAGIYAAFGMYSRHTMSTHYVCKS
jgi:hypothetical protein